MEKSFFKRLVPETAVQTASKLAARHVQRLVMLVRELMESKGYQSETTHQIRILCRKCTTALRILHRKAGDNIDKNKLVRGLRQLRKSLGPLRDADIRLEAFQTFVSKRKARRDEALDVAVHYAWFERYSEATSTLIKQWPELRNTLTAIRELCKRLSTHANKYPWRKRDDRWLMKQLDKWNQLANGTMKNEQKIHAFRIRTKRLRYLLQSLLPMKLQEPQQTWLAELDRLQQSLGIRRDLQNIAQWLNSIHKDELLRKKGIFTNKSSILLWRKECERSIHRFDKELSKMTSSLN